MAQYLLTHEWLLGLLMSGIIAALIGLIVGYSLVTERLAARRPKRAAPEAEPAPPSRVVSRPITDAPPAPSMTDQISGFIMSRLWGSAASREAPGSPIAPDAQEGVQGVANGRNPDNDRLTAQPVAQPAIPEAARDIIKFWAQVEDVERIIAGGKVGMVEAIELIFVCKRNGRADSVYGRARAAIQARAQPRYPQPLSPEQQRLRDELALDNR
jgi:hypothetical protein